jgi:hypothetical protein
LAFLRESAESMDAMSFLQVSPSFFLNLWMAATKCMLQGADGVSESGIVVAMGSNGREAGIKLAHSPAEWIRAPATVPSGPATEQWPTFEGLPAIGDSALIEAFGLGAMAMHLSTHQTNMFGNFMPEPAIELGLSLLSRIHPNFPLTHVRFGLSVRAIALCGKAPVVALGILDKAGSKGRIAGGIWQLPHEITKAAVKRLAA